jgi:hypothetical protein
MIKKQEKNFKKEVITEKVTNKVKIDKMEKKTISNEQKMELDTTKILEEIRNTSTFLGVLKCTYIGELVFSLSSNSDYNKYGGFENIVDIDSNFKDKLNFTEFCNQLENNYSHIL